MCGIAAGFAAAVAKGGADDLLGARAGDPPERLKLVQVFVDEELAHARISAPEIASLTC